MEQIQQCFEVGQHFESELIETIVDELACNNDNENVKAKETSHFFDDQFNSNDIKSDRLESKCGIDQPDEIDQY